MSINWMGFLPIIYLLLGIFVFSKKHVLKDYFASVLTNALIPTAIVISLSKDALKAIIMISFFFLLFLIFYFIAKKLAKQTILILCFCYLNIGWLGLPLSTLFLTEEQSSILINAYIGSAIFGNTVGVYSLLEGNGQLPIKKLLIQPTIIAVVLGVLLAIFPMGSTQLFSYLVTPVHFLLSFFGMSVLGIWLSQSQFNHKVLKQVSIIQLYKLLAFSLVAFLLYQFESMVTFTIVYDLALVILFISLLPPAVNIVVLETYYRGKGDSAIFIASGSVLSLVLLLFLGITQLIFL